MATSSSSTSSDSCSVPAASSGRHPNPYSCGQTLVLQRHTPGSSRSGEQSQSIVPHRSDDIPQLEWGCTHHSSTGTTNPSDTREITFAAEIRTGNKPGARILLIGDGLVAKIYDPLYYRCFDNRSNHMIDITEVADREYTNEASAYSALSKSPLQGSVMPRYHGSWTTKIDTHIDGQRCTREVRMILMEYIAGVSMMDINPFALEQRQRENIMCKVIEADTDLTLAGLEHNDFEPRNIMLSTSNLTASPEMNKFDHTIFDDPDLRVCIIDYGLSYMHNVVEGGCRERYCTFCGCSMFKYRNPLFHWAGADTYSQYGWLPSQKEATDWMWKVWGEGGRDGKYIKAKRNMECELGLPIYPKL